MAIVALTAANFDTTIANNEIVVVDFWAEWCKPCLSFAPIFQEVSEQYPNVLFAKIDIEQEEKLAQDFKVRSIPTLMVIRDSIAVYSEAGTMPASVLSDLVEQAQALNMVEIKAKLAAQNESDQSS